MIDIATETIITLDDAAKRLLVNTSTVFRWVTQGTKGLKLEAFRVGGRWRTSVKSLQRFADAQTPCPVAATEPRPRTPVTSVLAEKERLRRAEAAGRRLDEMLGIRLCATCDVRIDWLKGSVPKVGQVWCPKCLVVRKSATMGQRVRTFRCASFLSQQALSGRTSIGVDFIRAYEYDEKVPSGPHLAKLIEVLGNELVSGLNGAVEPASIQAPS